MFFALRKKINTKTFNYFVRNVLNTPKVVCNGGSDFVLVSQLCSTDLYMYLVALKTFTKQLTPKSIVIVGDRLTDNDNEILSQQISNLKIIPITEVDTAGFPNGGTWERLLTILDECQNNFVIQMDADTLTLTAMPEISQCISENASFTLGTAMGQKVVTFKEASELVADYADSAHVQIKAELAMVKVDQQNRLKYIRGCSGFAGFAKGDFNRSQLKEISNAIEQVIGKDKWAEWGSEQVSSSIVVANSSKPVVLPTTKYNYFKPGINISDYCFLHFIGDYRFIGGRYWKLAVELLKL